MSNGSALLATILVIANDYQGNKIVLRALCDSGCQINLITTDAAQKLRVKKSPTQTKILGLGGIQASKGKVELSITSTTNTNRVARVELFVNTRLLGPLPQSPVDISAWPGVRRLKLADPKFDQPGPIDMILGAHFYSQIVLNGIRRFDDGPTAQNTTFGWIVFGKIDMPICNIAITAPGVTNDELMQGIARFWELENAPIRHHRTKEEQMCEDIFTSTVRRDAATGRFIASIPMQPNAPKVVGSRQLALARLRQMHKRFEREPKLKESYIAFMFEYELLGHMSRVPAKELRNENAVYIPHHAANTEKFRVVFDGSCKMKDSPSPNDIQLNGERLQRDLTFVIARFRIGKVALCADIAKMYRQILVPPEQRDLQRILWSPSSHEPIREYRLNTQTYGMKSAAYVCIRALMECAYECQFGSPKVAEVIRNNFYVDDLLRSEPDAASAILLHNELNKVLGFYGFVLAKWITNDPTVNQVINGRNDTAIEMDKDNTNAVLGIIWNPANDEFQFRIKNPPSNERPTKRSIVSDTMRIFDPDGYLSPVTIRPKMIIQRLWLRKMEWDDVIEDSADEKHDHIAKDWFAFRQELPAVENIRIPRWVGIEPNAPVQIHGFSDASQEAYGVAFYVRVVQSSGAIVTNLVFSKTRVAPLTKATVPKLELSAAHLMAKLLPSVMEEHNVTIDNCYLRTDSMITLQWIRKSPAKLEVFQSNRVAEIQEISEGANWSHVVTKDNPADLCSRGVSPSKLANSTLWWHGPAWLRLPKNQWPEPNLVITAEDAKIINSAVKKAKPIVAAAIEPNDQIVAAAVNSDEQIIASVTDSSERTVAAGVDPNKPIVVDPGAPVTRVIIENGIFKEVGLHRAISDWKRLLRVTSYVIRFISKCRRHRNVHKQVGQITREEIVSAENLWLRYSQEIHFAKGMEEIQAGRAIDKKSPLYRLTPFIDGEGLLRLSGRLRRSNMSYDMIHPAVITSKCIVAQRIIYDAHRVTCHGGNQLMQQYIRNKYWIIGARAAIRAVVDHCYSCIRQKRKHAEQLMGQLPTRRVQPSRAFLHVSVDYMGPFHVKRYNARRVRIVDKAYVAVFVCMATRAVHLELVSSLTTEAFLAAFARFTNRRGRVESITSDNGTTFEGAANEFDAIVANQWKNAADSQSMRDNAIIWHFNPPYAPHMGGIHEAAVKSAKHHLRRVVGAQQLTFEEMATLLTHVEACLNSRPLVGLTDEPTDTLALTPAHFLIGEQLVSPLMRDLVELPRNRVSHFELLQKFAQEFWLRWSEEHVQALINRSKWHQDHENLKIGDIVLVLSEPRPQAKWPLGRIVAVYPDQEGKVRAADVFFEGRNYRRPVHKLCLMPEEAAGAEA